MQVTESTADGLKRELKVVVPATDLERKLAEKLDEIKGRVQLKGFRPGKVPVNHLRKIYGRSVMAEVVQQTVAETSQKAVADREERPAVPPDIALSEDKDEIDRVISGEADLAYTLSFEVLPEIKVTDLSKIKLEKLVADVAEADIEQALDRLAEDAMTYPDKDGAAEAGDQVTLDFEGRIDGIAFDGGKAEDAPLVLGSNQFIPGFEEGLIGAKAGEERSITVTFPEEYPAEHLAGQDAEFAVAVKKVGAPAKPELDDAFASAAGFETLAKLREAVERKLAQEYSSVTRMRVKRKLLDALDQSHTFDLPAVLVDKEFETIWNQVTSELEKAGKTFEDEGTSEEAERKKYQEIAERRVRLGLVLSEIGTKAEVKVTDDEVNNALMERIRQFPGQERQVFDFYQNNPEALAEFRVPLFEEKVVDYVIEMADVAEKTVSRDELFDLPEDDDEA